MHYCVVKNCENFDCISNVHKFKIPTGNRGKIWTDIIGDVNHQNYSNIISGSNICQNHFASDLLVKKGNTSQLKPNAIPTLFRENIQNEILEQNESQDIVQSLCSKCKELTNAKLHGEIEIIELKKKLSTQKTKLEQEKSALKKQVKSLQSEIVKLKNEEENLKKEIATKEQLNVN